MAREDERRKEDRRQECRECIARHLASDHTKETVDELKSICQTLKQEVSEIQTKVIVMEQGFEFNVQAIKEIKELHEKAINKLVEDVKDRITPLTDKIAWAQRIVYLMFAALVLTVAGRFILSSIDKGGG